MAAELDFTPPEIPEPTLMENILHYGLFFGAIFQLICVLAIILPIPKSHKTELFHLLKGDYGLDPMNKYCVRWIVLATVLPSSFDSMSICTKSMVFHKPLHEEEVRSVAEAVQYALNLFDTEGFESKSSEVVKKTKAAAASASKKPKKETKKKR